MSEGNAAVSGAAQDTGTDPTLAQGVVAPPQDSAAGSAAPLTEPDVDAEEEIDDVDAELEAMKQRLKEMEDEAKAVKEKGSSFGTDEGQNSAGANVRLDGVAPHNDVASGPSSSMESDARSIYVGNVDYGATPEELQAHFADCGTINRVTIMCNRATGAPKGFAYIEFVDEDAVQNAVILNESPFRGRPLKVTPKRTNVPGLASRAGFRGGFRGRGSFRARGHGFRGRPRGRWVPY